MSAQSALRNNQEPSNIIASPNPQAAVCLLLHGIFLHVLLVQLGFQLHNAFGQDVLQRLRLLSLGVEGVRVLETTLEGMGKKTNGETSVKSQTVDTLLHGPMMAQGCWAVGIYIISTMPKYEWPSQDPCRLALHPVGPSGAGAPFRRPGGFLLSLGALQLFLQRRQLLCHRIWRP